MALVQDVLGPILLVDKPVSMLVDTGSSVSILRYGFFSQHAQLRTAAISPSSTSVKSVNGVALNVYDSTLNHFEVGGLSVHQKVILADIVPDVIFGLDFVCQHGCVINYAQKEVFPGVLSCGQLILHLYFPTVKLLILPPILHVMLDWASLSRYRDIPKIISYTLVDLLEASQSSEPALVGIVKPTEKFLEKYCLGAAQIVSTASTCEIPEFPPTTCHYS